MRIKKGAEEFDPDHCFNMSNMTMNGVEGGKLQYSITNFYAGNGEPYLYAYFPALAVTNPDMINDKTNYTLKADLYNCSMQPLDFPCTNSYSCAITQKGDKVLFGLTTQSNRAGIITYNRKPGSAVQIPS